MTERDKLIEELNIGLRNNLSDYRIEEIADFILADRARIVEPLVKGFKNAQKENELEYIALHLREAMVKTLENAGI